MASESPGEPWGHRGGTLPRKSLKRRDRPLGSSPGEGTAERSRGEEPRRGRAGLRAEGEGGSSPRRAAEGKEGVPLCSSPLMVLPRAQRRQQTPKAPPEIQCNKRDNGSKKGEKKGFQNAGECKRGAAIRRNLRVKLIYL